MGRGLAIYFQYVRGHEVYTEDGKRYFFSDNNTRAENVDRPCKKCGLKSDDCKAPDACLGYLPGVLFACCGHGVKGQDYVYTVDKERMTLKQYMKMAKVKYPDAFCSCDLPVKESNNFFCSNCERKKVK